LAGSGLLDALKQIAAGENPKAVVGSFNRVFAYNSFATTEAREQFSNYASNADSLGLSAEDKKLVLESAIREMEEQVKSAAGALRYHIFLGSLYAKAGEFEKGEALFEKALLIAPRKQQVYFVFADLYLAKGDNEKAFDLLERAYNLDTSYKEAAKNLAIVAVLTGRDEQADELLEKHFAKKAVADAKLATAYFRVGNYERVRDIWLEFINEDPNNAQYRISLAATYVELGEREKAIRALEKAIELNPLFKEQGEYYINEIKAGRNP
jgi:Flp pilus assembly protein TadD